jgi:hypothetical protein
MRHSTLAIRYIRVNARNQEVLKRVKEEGNILHRVKRRKDNLIGDILRGNCLLKYVIEGEIEGRLEVTDRRLRRRKHLMGDVKEKRGYWKYKDEALICTLWRNGFGRICGPAVRQTIG